MKFQRLKMLGSKATASQMLRFVSLITIICILIVINKFHEENTHFHKPSSFTKNVRSDLSPRPIFMLPGFGSSQLYQWKVKRLQQSPRKCGAVVVLLLLPCNFAINGTNFYTFILQVDESCDSGLFGSVGDRLWLVDVMKFYVTRSIPCPTIL